MWALSGLLPLLHFLNASEWLQFERQLVSPEWWRLPGSLFVHWNIEHALLNAGVLAAVGALLPARQRPWLACALITGGLASCAMLQLALPDVTHYRGASPLVAATLPIAILTLWTRGASGRGIALVILAGVVAMACAQAAGLAGSSVLPEGVRPTWELHLAGLLAGTPAALASYRSRSISPSS